MKYNIIHADDYLLIVDHEEELKNREVCLFTLQTNSYLTLFLGEDQTYKKHCSKILAHLPLNGSAVISTIPLLPDLKVLDETVNSISEFNTPIAFELYAIGTGMFIPAIQQTIGASNNWVGRYIYKQEEQ